MGGEGAGTDRSAESLAGCSGPWWSGTKGGGQGKRRPTLAPLREEGRPFLACAWVSNQAAWGPPTPATCDIVLCLPSS